MNLSVSIKLTGDCGVDVLKANIAGRVGFLIDNYWSLGDSLSVISGSGSFFSYYDMAGAVTSNYSGTLPDGRVCHSRGSATFSAKKQ